MYQLLKHTNHQLPVAININNNCYPDLIMSGYEVLNEGTKRDMETLQREMIEEFATELDIINN